MAQQAHPDPRSSEAPRAWLLFHPDDLPEGWKGRGVPMVLVPMLPDEVGFALEMEGALPGADPEDEPLLRLAARGLPSKTIARELHMSLRSVQRRLGRFTRRFNLGSRAELAAFLARRGF